jgi:hypothetical protein
MIIPPIAKPPAETVMDDVQAYVVVALVEDCKVQGPLVGVVELRLFNAPTAAASWSNAPAADAVAVNTHPVPPVSVPAYIAPITEPLAPDGLLMADRVPVQVPEVIATELMVLGPPATLWPPSSITL